VTTRPAGTATVASLPRSRPLPARWLVVAVAVLAGALLAGVGTGPASLPLSGVVGELVSVLPGVEVGGLTERQTTILLAIRLPRVVLGAIVGATLATAGATYQGVFRNPLADPYLLGVASGAGLGATITIAAGVRPLGAATLPLFAFVGAVGAVTATWVLGRSAGGRGTGALILAGVAVSLFLGAIQTFLMQRYADTIREVYGFLLGQLGTAGWTDVRTAAPWALIAMAAMLASRRLLDVLAVGDVEATALGLPTTRVRLAVVGIATLGTAAVVAVSGLIGFVGIVVPHAVRLLVGTSYRAVLPLSLLLGAAFLVLADLLARTVLSPAELPIGVVTAFVGGPFFLLVLRTSRRALL
jgi:iron complex transport system permease protein